MAFIISLILIGIVLILVEILLIPGVGVAGILGLVSLAGSCFYAFNQFGPTAGAAVTALNAALLVFAVVYVLRAKTWKKLALSTKIESKAQPEVETTVSVGDTGKTLTRLAPMGTARLNGTSYEVKSLEGMMDPGVDVEVVLIEDNTLYVKPLQTDF